MKRTLSIVSVVALLGVGLMVQPGLSQPNGPAGDLRADAFKTQALVALNTAGLSVDQLETVQGLAQATLDAQEALQAEHEAFQEFLTDWSGTPEAFEAALEDARQSIVDAREALAAQMTENVEMLQNELTAAQYEALEQVRPNARMGHGPQGAGPGIGPKASGPGPERDGRFGQRGPGSPDEHVERLGLFAHSDLLLEVVTAKIAALQS